MNRIEIINWLIERYKYTSYLEIGVGKGECFHQIKAPVKVGIDPVPQFDSIIGITSDDYFAINKDKYDIIFIDGMHKYLQVFRDICNSLRVLNKNGRIVVHDCNPNEYTATEDMESHIWNGTVWKAILHCRMLGIAYIEVVNADWGCGIITPNEVSPIDFGISVEQIILDLSYNFLYNNREAILSLISVDKFKEKYNGGKNEKSTEVSLVMNTQSHSSTS